MWAAAWIYGVPSDECCTVQDMDDAMVEKLFRAREEAGTNAERAAQRRISCQNLSGSVRGIDNVLSNLGGQEVMSFTAMGDSEPFKGSWMYEVMD